MNCHCGHVHAPLSALVVVSFSAYYWLCPYYTSFGTGNDNISLYYILYCLFRNRIMSYTVLSGEQCPSNLRVAVGSKPVEQLIVLPRKLENHAAFSFVQKDSPAMCSERRLKGFFNAE